MTLLKQVQIEMALQKAHCRCLEGIPALNHAAQHFPPALVTQMIQAIYRLSPVSYTNLGVLDHEKLSFRGCGTQSCFLTGAYRQAPDFQLTVSTFQNICTLNCTLRGSPDDRETGQHMLRQTAGEILSWLGSDAET